jgi:hypothetical protein
VDKPEITPGLWASAVPDIVAGVEENSATTEQSSAPHAVNGVNGCLRKIRTDARTGNFAKQSVDNR